MTSCWPPWWPPSNRCRTEGHCYLGTSTFYQSPSLVAIMASLAKQRGASDDIWISITSRMYLMVNMILKDMLTLDKHTLPYKQTFLYLFQSRKQRSNDLGKMVFMFAQPRFYQTRSSHYSDVIMSAMTSRITGVSIVYSFVQALIKENIKAPRHWPLFFGEFTGHR